MRIPPFLPLKIPAQYASLLRPTALLCSRGLWGTMAESKRDWLAISISLLSLGIAGLTGYRTIFDQRDDVRFVVGDALKISRNKNDFVLQQDQALTFINSGNRQAVVNDIYGMLVLVTSPGDPRSQCERDLPLAKNIFLNPSQLVLKPGEIQVLQAKVPAEYPWKKEGTSLRFHEDGAVEGAANYLVCIEMYVTTPDSSSVRWVQPLYTLPANGAGEEAFEKVQPIKVLKRSYFGLS